MEEPPVLHWEEPLMPKPSDSVAGRALGTIFCSYLEQRCWEHLLQEFHSFIHPFVLGPLLTLKFNGERLTALSALAELTVFWRDRQM